ncbi:MAG: SipW-dependent-type signal peptide-containing protein [Bacilli bacterium]|nr:SipW-dependent-type signal peptide-containing protein [Bacilli bacterium]
MENKKRNVAIGASLCLVLLLVIGATYAYWTTTEVQTDTNDITTDCLSIYMTNDTTAAANRSATGGISLLQTYPVSDEEGMSNAGYTFTVTNRCTIPVKIDIDLASLNHTGGTAKAYSADPLGQLASGATAEAKAAAEASSEYINSEYINVYLANTASGSEKVLAQTKVASLTNTSAQVWNAGATGATTQNGAYDVNSGLSSYEEKFMLTDVIAASGSNTYNLKLWLDKYAPETQMSNYNSEGTAQTAKSYKAKVVVYGWLGDSKGLVQAS